MGFLISLPPEDTDWRIEPHELLHQLSEHWAANIKTLTDPGRKYSHEWIVATGNGSIEGMLNRRRTSISLDGDLQDAASFAIWFRRFVPNEVPLLFYDDEFNANIELNQTTTIDEIVSAFS